jgi:hypothetical protein
MALPQIQYINMREAVGGGASQPSALDELQQLLPHLQGASIPLFVSSMRFDSTEDAPSP